MTCKYNRKKRKCLFNKFCIVYGSTFPNETHCETLLSGRQRFGNRSANMFFVRPARHIACPRRLKYIQGTQ
jgi:hypothetical protein